MPWKDPEINRAKQLERTRAWFARNPDYVKAKRTRRIAENRAKVTELKKEPCTDCGQTYPYWVMEFDHVRGAKKYNVARMANQNMTWTTIQREIDKCDLVCANCHRTRHQEEFEKGTQEQ